MRYFLFAITLVTNALAAPQRVESFHESLTQAKATNQPVAVYIHGSDWQPASKIFGRDIWRSPGREKQLKNPVILTSKSANCSTRTTKAGTPAPSAPSQPSNSMPPTATC